MVTLVPRDPTWTESIARLRTCVVREHSIAARKAFAQGAQAGSLHLVISGIVARYRLLNDGRRQITALHLPGDLPDLSAHLFGGDAVPGVALTTCRIGEIPRAALFSEYGPRAEWSAFCHDALARDCAIAMEQIVSLGRRSAFEAMAHLFCEFWARLNAVGQTEGLSFAFPLTQVELSDVLGLTPVHTNRILRDLRNAGLLNVAKRRATLLNPAGLRQVADFDQSYLQVDGPSSSGPGQHSALSAASGSSRSARSASKLRPINRPPQVGAALS